MTLNYGYRVYEALGNEINNCYPPQVIAKRVWTTPYHSTCYNSFEEAFAFSEAQSVGAITTTLTNSKWDPNTYSIAGFWAQTGYKTYYYFAKAPRTNSSAPKTIGQGCKSSDEETVQLGNPIGLNSECKLQTIVDYQASSGYIQFSRYYNSKNDKYSPLGVGWSGSYFQKVKKYSTPSLVQVLRENGGAFTYQWNGAEWVSDTDIRGKLLQTTSGFRYVTPGGIAEVYDIDGRLVSISRGSVITELMSYDALGRLSTVSGGHGHALVFNYGSNGVLSSVTTPDGHVINYSYNANSILYSVTYPDGATQSYSYDKPSWVSALTGIFNDSSQYATFVYDDLGRAISTEHSGGQEQFTVAYQTDTLTTVTDATGVNTQYVFSTNLGIKKLISKQNLSDNKVLSQKFDAANNLVCKQKRGGPGYKLGLQHVEPESEHDRGAGRQLRLTCADFVHPYDDLPVSDPRPRPPDRRRILFGRWRRLQETHRDHL
jgi:YD repeat-containing protein